MFPVQPKIIILTHPHLKPCSHFISQDLRNNKKLMEIEVNHSSSMITQMQQEITDLTTQNSEYR